MAGIHSDLESNPRVENNDRNHERQLSSNTDDVLMQEVAFSRTNPASPGRACQLAMEQYQHQSRDIFDVKSGPFKGMQVPESLRCAIFQSNIAVAAGLIRPSEVTVRALDFGKLMQSKNYHEQPFREGARYPDGTYIVGEGARDGTNSRHVAMVCGGRLIHTRDGKIVNEAISQKFSNGAYDRIKVYIPPGSRRTAESDSPSELIFT